jgi:hypothetical protein
MIGYSGWKTDNGKERNTREREKEDAGSIALGRKGTAMHR